MFILILAANTDDQNIHKLKKQMPVMDTSKLTALISQYHVHTMENRAMGKLPLHSSERLNVQLLTQIATYVSVATTLKQSAKRKNPKNLGILFLIIVLGRVLSSMSSVQLSLHLTTHPSPLTTNILTNSSIPRLKNLQILNRTSS